MIHAKYSKRGGSGNHQEKKKDFNKRKVQCYNCENLGHYAYEYCLINGYNNQY